MLPYLVLLALIAFSQIATLGLSNPVWERSYLPNNLEGVGFERFNVAESLLRRKTSLAVCIFLGVCLIVLCGLRGLNVGADTYGYAQSFYSAKGFYGLEELRDSYVNSDSTEVDYAMKDVFFKILNNFCSGIFSHHQYFFFLMAVLSYIGPTYLIYRYSPMPSLSFLLYITFGFCLFGFSGIRQAVACSIVCFSVPFIQERKLIPFLIVIFLASLFHKSAMCTLLFYFLNTELSPKKVVLYLLLVGGMFVSLPLFIRLGGMLIGSFDARIGHYLEESDIQLRSTVVFLHGVISVFCFILYKFVKRNHPQFLFLYNFLLVGFFFYLFVILHSSIFFRIAMYFALMEVVLVPICLFSIKDKSIQFILTLMVSICCYLYAWHLISHSACYPYRFFWDNSWGTVF